MFQVPALESGTGWEQISVACNGIQEWGLQDNINAIIFGTTDVNTGRKNGTCTIMENVLQKPLHVDIIYKWNNFEKRFWSKN